MTSAHYKFLTSFSRNMIIAYIVLCVARYLMLYPFQAVDYLYVLPAAMMFWSVFSLRMAPSLEPKFRESASRMLFSSASVLLLSPFAGWWGRFHDNFYFFSSFCALAFSAAVFLFHASGYLVEALRENGSWGLVRPAKFARSFLLYGLIAPLGALFLGLLYGKYRGSDVYYILNDLGWRRLIFFIPVFYLGCFAEYARHGFERKEHVDDAKDR